MMNLNQHGSACRCLLRLRENAGEPFLSESDFVTKYRARFPAWEKQPGRLSAEDFLALAIDLKLATAVDRVRDYDRLVQEHAAGNDILVFTEHAPLQSGLNRPPHRTTTLVTAMDASGLDLWWPDPSGHDEVLPRADRVWWARWRALGIVLQRPPQPQVESGASVPADAIPAVEQESLLAAHS